MNTRIINCKFKLALFKITLSVYGIDKINKTEIIKPLLFGHLVDK